MQKSIFLIYETDKFHTRNSMRLIGAPTNQYNAEIIVKQYCESNNINISSDTLHSLFKNQQTQGLASEFELLIEEVIINQLID